MNLNISRYFFTKVEATVGLGGGSANPIIGWHPSLSRVVYTTLSLRNNDFKQFRTGSGGSVIPILGQSTYHTVFYGPLWIMIEIDFNYNSQ